MQVAGSASLSPGGARNSAIAGRSALEQPARGGALSTAERGGSAAPAVQATAPPPAGSPANAPASGTSATAPPAAANAWVMMGYDSNNWYFNPDEKTLSVDNAPLLKELWRASVDTVNTGSPVIAEGKVFVGSNLGVYALDLETGQRIWSRSDITSMASFAYDAGFVYVHNFTPASVYKLKAADGSTVWGPIPSWDSDKITGESSPIIALGKVIVGHSAGVLELTPDPSTVGYTRGGVQALDIATGDVSWSYYTVPDPSKGGENGACVWSSVAIDVNARTVFASTGNNYTVLGPNSDALHAIDLATGALRWKTQVRAGDLSYQISNDYAQDTDFGANPILAELDGRRVVAAADKGATFWVLDRDSGEILWKRDQLSPAHSATCGGVLMNGAFDGRLFYVVSNDSKETAGGAIMHALDPRQQGASVWTHNFDRISWGAPSLANGLVVVPNDTQLFVMNAADGKVLTSFDTGGTIAGGAAAIAQGKIVVKSGLLYTADVKYNDQVICYGLPK